MEDHAREGVDFGLVTEAKRRRGRAAVARRRAGAMAGLIGGGVAVWVFLGLAVCQAADVPPKRVLVLYSFSRDVAPFNAVAGAFRTTLASELDEPVDFSEASLEANRFPEPTLEEPFVAGRISVFLQVRSGHGGGGGQLLARGGGLA